MIMLSGGFDPLHSGHVDYIRVAGYYFDEVFIALNSDEWLMKKKGYVFMPFEERAAILFGMKKVREVIAVDDSDGTVCEAIRRIKPEAFGNGGDRGPHNTPEAKLCEQMGIEVIYELGGEKSNSSSVIMPDGWILREWGRHVKIAEGSGHLTKILEFNGSERTSMQRHKNRTEIWMCIHGEVKLIVEDEERTLCPGYKFTVPAGAWHQAWGTKGSRAVEVWLSKIELSENDKEVR